jgi:EmrB/QacA subfamily drug resistance transporter
VTSAQRWTLIVVCTSTAVLLINVSAPNVALDAIAHDLHASFTDLQWVLSGYALALAVFQLTAGSLADLFGRRKLFVIGVSLFTVASGLCANATSAGLLIGARVLQGLGAAIMFPSSLALLAQEFQGPARARAIGVWGAVIGLAFAAGPLVGGVLVDGIGWQAIFWLGVALGLPTIALALTRIGESRDPDPRPVDWPGVVTLSLGLFLIVFAVLRGNALGWTSPQVLGLVAGGAVSLAAFAAVELRTAHPMLDLRLFRNRTFLGATVIVATLAGSAFGAFVYLSLFLLDVGGGSPIEVGLWLAPLALVAFVTSLAAGRRAGRVPLTGALALGMGLTAGGLLLMTGVDSDSSWLHLLAGLVVVGAGLGLANPLVTFTHLGVLPPAQGGVASGINNTARQLGLSIGIAALGALLQSHIADDVAVRTDGLGAARAAVTDRIADGNVAAATQLAPPAARNSLRTTYEAAFASGLNEVLLIAVALALTGLAAALLLVRTRDLWRPQTGASPRPLRCSRAAGGDHE